MTGHRVVHDLRASAFPQNEIRTKREPLDMAVTGVMSFPHTDFETGLGQELKAIGATQKVNAYAQGVRRGGVLVSRHGQVQRWISPGEIMNRHGAIETEELTGGAK